jgi:hypothetical protein
MLSDPCPKTPMSLEERYDGVAVEKEPHLK